MDTRPEDAKFASLEKIIKHYTDMRVMIYLSMEAHGVVSPTKSREVTGLSHKTTSDIFTNLTNEGILIKQDRTYIINSDDPYVINILKCVRKFYTGTIKAPI